MADKVRIAMMNMAHAHAKGYAEQVAANPEAEMKVIWDDNPERGKPYAEKYGVPFTTNMDEALDRKDVDAIIVNAPTVQHKEIYLKAIARGKHVMTEKALTITTKDADEVVAAVKKNGKVKFTVSLPNRTRPETLLIKQLIDDGYLGDITTIRARVGHQAAIDKWFKGGELWFVDEKQAGGGAMFDLGCHTTDFVRWIMGPPKSAVGIMNNFSKVYDIDDQGVAIVEFKNKGLGILDSSFVHRSGPNLIEVFGTEGYIGRGLPGQNVVVQSRKLRAGNTMDVMASPVKLPDAKPMIMQAWIGAILRDEPLTTTVEDGRNLTQILEGCYSAWKTGKRYDFTD